jgi:uncharacterized protein YheU (UPF0270 family)
LPITILFITLFIVPRFPAHEQNQVEGKMTAFLRTFFLIFLSCQVIVFGGFAFIDHGFAAEPEALTKKSSGAWKEAALLDKGVSPGRRFVITWPAVTINDKGDAIAVWIKPDEDLWPRVRMSEYKNGKWEKPVLLSLATGDGKKPKVALAANGDAVVVWEQKDVKVDNRIFLAERRDGVWKTPRSDDESISIGNWFAWEQVVAMNDRGDTVIAWSQETENGEYAIFKSEYRNGKWLHPKDINDFISIRGEKGSGALRPSVALNNSGDTLIAWEQMDENRKSQIYKSEFRDNGWNHPQDFKDHINPRSSGRRDGAYRPQAAMDESGNAAIAWQQINGSSQGIYLSEFYNGAWRHPKAAGKTVNPPTMISPALHDLQMGRDGTAILLWSSYSNRRDALYKSELRDNTWRHSLEEEPFIASPTSFEFKIVGKSAVSKSDRVVVGWMQRESNQGSRVYIAEADKGKWRLPGQLMSDEAMQATGLAVAASPNGNSVIAWSQTDGKNEGIFARVFRANQ